MNTIPPGVRYQFELLAQEVCDASKVDYGERAQLFSEIVRQMEQRWTKNIESGLSTDGAMEAAILRFGSVESASKMYRGGFRGLLHRVFFYQRYSVHRLIAPVAFCLFHSWLRSSGSLNVKILADKSLEWRFIGFGWDYYIGIIVVTAIFVTRIAIQTFRAPAIMAQLLAFLVALILFAQIGKEWLLSVIDMLHNWQSGLDNMLFTSLILFLFTVEAVIFFFVVALVGAEIFDLHTRKRTAIA